MSKANGKGLKSTSERSKAREAGQWTGRSPLVPHHPLNGEHAEHIEFILDAWTHDAGGIPLSEQQGTQGMPDTRSSGGTLEKYAAKVAQAA